MNQQITTSAKDTPAFPPPLSLAPHPSHLTKMPCDFEHPLVQRIATFLRQAGLSVEPARVDGPTVFPGMRIEKGKLLVDESRLEFPGDLLHEAGHLAVVPAERRSVIGGDDVGGPAEEMMAIAWSWAALKYLDLDPTIVFHEKGYRGGSADIIANFTAGRYFGVPMLQYAGLTYEAKRSREAGVDPFPHMIKWVREC